MSGPQRIQVITNAFPITQIPTKSYHMYDVFTPDVEQRNKKIQLFQHLQMRVAPKIFNPRLVYDGQAIAYSPGRLNLGGNSGATWDVNLGSPDIVQPGSRGSFQIRLNLTSSPAIDPNHVNDLIHNRQNTNRALVATNLIQLIIRQGPNQNYTNNGRAYFTGIKKESIPRSGLELWPGIWQSVRPTIGRMTLNIDTCTAAVYKAGQLIDVVMDFLGARNLRDLDLPAEQATFKKVEKFLKKLRIKIKTGKGKSRIKTIRGLVSRAGDYRFTLEDGLETTVQRHFREAHGIVVEYPKIIGVRLTGKSSLRQDVVPAELCEIEVGQLFKQRLPDEIVPQMVKFSAMRPDIRLQRIVEGARDYDKSEFVAESGMRVDPRPMTVDALLLPVPGVEYSNGAIMTPRDGKWNVVGKKLHDAKPLLSWAIINFCPSKLNERTVANIETGILNSCHNLGMRTNRAHFTMPGNEYTIVDSLNEAMKRIFTTVRGDTGALASTILIILLPTHGGAIRNAVKNWGDIASGVTTNCLKQDKLERANDQYWNNVALKLNARLGGRNSKGVSSTLLELQKQPFMIMGADVGHPGPGIQKPSVTSLVYSHDTHATQYAAITGIQAPRVEFIENLHNYVATAVDNFGKKNNVPPQRVIFFRDGLSEGEFDQVAGTEIEAIKKAFQAVWQLRKATIPLPKLTFVIVGKRHHATFYPARNGSGDRTGNCHPGTVIESGITHPAIVDFYLQSHAAIQGTSRSSHYIVLLDENFDNNIHPLQDLAYTLCHVYAKATRSVSIPAPVYYADSVCSRLGFHVDASANLMFDDGASNVSGSSPFDLDQWQRHFKPTHGRIERNMYFL